MIWAFLSDLEKGILNDGKPVFKWVWSLSHSVFSTYQVGCLGWPVVANVWHLLLSPEVFVLPPGERNTVCSAGFCLGAFKQVHVGTNRGAMATSHGGVRLKLLIPTQTIHGTGIVTYKCR